LPEFLTDSKCNHTASNSIPRLPAEAQSRVFCDLQPINPLATNRPTCSQTPTRGVHRPHAPSSTNTTPGTPGPPVFPSLRSGGGSIIRS